jgi:hypothetical protein
MFFFFPDRTLLFLIASLPIFYIPDKMLKFFRSRPHFFVLIEFGHVGTIFPRVSLTRVVFFPTLDKDTFI